MTFNPVYITKSNILMIQLKLVDFVISFKTFS